MYCTTPAVPLSGCLPPMSVCRPLLVSLLSCFLCLSADYFLKECWLFSSVCLPVSACFLCLPSAMQQITFWRSACLFVCHHLLLPVYLHPLSVQLLNFCLSSLCFCTSCCLPVRLPLMSVCLPIDLLCLPAGLLQSFCWLSLSVCRPTPECLLVFSVFLRLLLSAYLSVENSFCLPIDVLRLSTALLQSVCWLTLSVCRRLLPVCLFQLSEDPSLSPYRRGRACLFLLLPLL